MLSVSLHSCHINTHIGQCQHLPLMCDSVYTRDTEHLCDFISDMMDTNIQHDHFYLHWPLVS